MVSLHLHGSPKGNSPTAPHAPGHHAVFFLSTLIQPPFIAGPRVYRRPSAFIAVRLPHPDAENWSRLPLFSETEASRPVAPAALDGAVGDMRTGRVKHKHSDKSCPIVTLYTIPYDVESNPRRLDGVLTLTV